MPTHNDDQRVQGLHLLSVVDAAKQFVAALATAKDYREGLRGSPVDRYLEMLINEVNRLSMFERRASQRGSIVSTDADETAAAVQAARSRVDVSLEQSDAVQASAKVDAAAEFSPDILDTSGEKSDKEKDDDELAVFEV